MAHGAAEQSDARRVLVKVLKTQIKYAEPAVAIHDGTAKLENSMFSTVDWENIPHLLNIFGLVTLVDHAISSISLLICMMWEVLMSLFKAAVVICWQPRKGNCVVKQTGGWFDDRGGFLSYKIFL